MVNRKVSQSSSRSAPASPRKEPTKRPATEKPSRLAGLQRTFRETVAELRKVQWPDRVTTRNLTLVVIGMSAALAAILGVFDAVLTRLIEWLVQL